MLLHLTDLSPEPLHAQISRQIRARVLAGEMEADMALPSIRGLAKDHKVSVITVQRAYDDLLREGLLQSRRGKGFFVAPLSQSQKRRRAQERFGEHLNTLIEAALAEGLDPEQIRRAVEESLSGEKS